MPIYGIMNLQNNKTGGYIHGKTFKTADFE